jgi:hypothetical protein
VPVNGRSPDTPRIYLEVVACTPDSKEHESLLLTQAMPSHIHAALLLIGLEPGRPGKWEWTGDKIMATPPSGPRLVVTARYEKEGQTVEADPAQWIIDIGTNRTLAQSAGGDHWVFAGSQMVTLQGREHYRADSDGTLIGLTTFGTETIAWTGMFNPDSGFETPHWIVNAATVPDYKTPVVVRLKKQDRRP